MVWPLKFIREVLEVAARTTPYSLLLCGITIDGVVQLLIPVEYSDFISVKVSKVRTKECPLVPFSWNTFT